MINSNNTLLTPAEAASWLGMSKSWLAKSRLNGEGPPYLKIGRAVRYRHDDLELWLSERHRRSTSAQEPSQKARKSASGKQVASHDR